MTNQANNITVHVKYGNLEKTFIGKPEDVWLSINKFFSEFLPTFEIVKRITLSIDLQKLLKDLEDIIAFSPEGPNILIPKNKLTDNETLALWLLAHYIGFHLGKIENDALAKEELQIKLGKTPKITGTRLSELVKNEIIKKTPDEKYKTTTFGVLQMQKEMLPRIKTKMSS